MLMFKSFYWVNMHVQVEIVVSECNARSLPELERKYRDLVSQLVRQYTGIHCWRLT